MTASRTPRDILLDEVAFLVDDGVRTFQHLAWRLGMSRDSISLALRRAADEGDERAIEIRSRLPVRRTS